MAQAPGGSESPARSEPVPLGGGPHPMVLLAIRLAVAGVWLYEGLVLKLLLQAPHELAVVASLPAVLPLTPAATLGLIGAGETALALGGRAWLSRWSVLGVLGGILLSLPCQRPSLVDLLLHSNVVRRIRCRCRSSGAGRTTSSIAFSASGGR